MHTELEGKEAIAARIEEIKTQAVNNGRDLTRERVMGDLEEETRILSLQEVMEINCQCPKCGGEASPHVWIWAVREYEECEGHLEKRCHWECQDCSIALAAPYPRQEWQGWQWM